MKGKKRSETDAAFQYLDEIAQLKAAKCTCTQAVDFLNLNTINEALKVSVAYKYTNLLTLITQSKASKLDFVNSLYASDIVEMTTEHVRYLTFFYFMQRINKGDIKCAGTKKHLTNLCMLYGLSNLYKDHKACHESGYFTGGVAYSTLILEALKSLNQNIRPYALSIIESLKRPDHVLCSAIGNSYGDIYETHLEWAKDSRLNHTKAGHAIPDGYMEYIMPILKAKM